MDVDSSNHLSFLFFDIGVPYPLQAVSFDRFNRSHGLLLGKVDLCLDHGIAAQQVLRLGVALLLLEQL